MNGCGAVYVVLGERPDLDRLERCTREPAWSAEAGLLDRCAEHQQQLGWVMASLPRSVAYQRQVARYERERFQSSAAEELQLL